MKYLILDLPSERPGGRSRDLRKVAASGAWARFGRRVLVYGADAGWRELRDSLPKRARRAAGSEGSVRKAHLHLVVQKGRTFQLENPEVRVILDTGRFLVVDLPPARARSLAGRRDPCYQVEALRDNATVFEELAPVTRTEKPGPAVASAVDAVAQSGFEAVIARLTSIRSRLSTGPGYAEAAAWMRDELAALGLEARLEAIDVDGAASHNVIATRRGTGNDRQQVLVTGHLDSVNHAGGASAPAPGADDNGSGSAGVLALARALAGVSSLHDVSFILFGGEEQGLFGSTQYVAALSGPERGRIRAVLNMDMIGSKNAEPASVLLEGAPLSQGMIDALAASAAQFTGLVVQTSLKPFASDHVPFIEAGVPAVLTIEGADGANDAIHTGNDTLDRIDAAYATEILRMNAGFLATVAEVGAAPVPSHPLPPVQPTLPPVLAPTVPPSVPLPASPGLPVPCCGGIADFAGAFAGEAAALRELSGHYHALFAQYARLQGEGAIAPADGANWQAAWLAYGRLADPEGNR